MFFYGNGVASDQILIIIKTCKIEKIFKEEVEHINSLMEM